MQTYAIGDIHGHLDKLIEMQALIAADRAEHGTEDTPIVHLGDLVDRGPHSQGVIEHLRAGLARGENWVVLKGNHDRMFTGFLDDPKGIDPGLREPLHWLNPRLGGGVTLASYGVRSPMDRRVAAVHQDALAAVPAAHRDFILGLPTSYRRGEAIFVHAGIRPGVPLEEQHETDLLWIRQPFLSDGQDHGALIVHGHTAIDAPTHYGNRLNIDTGAGYGRALTAVVIEGRRAFHLTPEGRVLLRPVQPDPA